MAAAGAQIVEEIKASNPEVVMHDLSEAVDEIIEAAKSEVTAGDVAQAEQIEANLAAAIPVLEVTPKPVIDLATIVEFIPVKNKAGRYRLVSPKLRAFIQESMDVYIIEDKMLETPTDTDEVKAIRLNISVAAIDKFYGSFHDFVTINDDDIKVSSSGLTVEEYKAFLDDLTARRDIYLAEERAKAQLIYETHMAAFNGDAMGFEDLCVGMRTETGLSTRFIFVHDGHDVAGQLIQAHRKDTMFGPYLSLTFRVHSHNGEGLNWANHTVQIFGYEGLNSLADNGLERAGDCSSERAKKLIARGAAYLELVQKPTYVTSKGNITRKQGRSLEIINAVGRVMIDIVGLESIDTNFWGFFCKAEQDSTVIPFKSVEETSDDIKLTCVPFVYGFSFKAKRWGQLNVVDLSPIQFRTDAYEMLVLDQDTKDLIFASVTDGSSDNDIIAGKGGGSINLLEGPPGVGKTLTAEAVAEKLQKPLYMVSTGELGTTVNQLEESLKEILEIAESWGAVLLIDEADIFLETRDKHDVVRNAMVAVFLRLLEYYQGVMFLTTNRADNIDPAFESRITLCIHYSELSYDSRIQVWTNLLKSAKLEDNFDVEQLAEHKLNGRQIKGIIKSARALANFCDEILDEDHFEAVIKQKADFKSSTVFKLGHGLDNRPDDAPTPAPAVVVADKKPGLLQRIWNTVNAN